MVNIITQEKIEDTKGISKAIYQRVTDNKTSKATYFYVATLPFTAMLLYVRRNPIMAHI
jgi:hypothetical protein